MNKTLKHILVFLPALLLMGLFLFIRVVQYEPLNPPSGADTTDGLLQIPIFANDPIMGSAAAPKTLIAFEDLGCEHCHIQHGYLKELINKHPTQVKVVFKTLSVTKFPQDTRTAHQYAFCAHQQGKFEAFKDLAFINYSNLSEVILQTIADKVALDDVLLAECLASHVPDAYLSQNEAVASSVGLQSVPTIFYQNRQVALPNSVAGWEQLLGL